MALTAKQQKFVDEYMIDCNATQAAIRAGYSEKTARQIGEQNLSKLDILSAIKARQAAERKKNIITFDRLLLENRAMALSNIDDYLTFDASGVSIKDSRTLTRRQLSAISEVSETRTDKSVTVKFKLHNKIAAGETIIKMLGFGTDKDDNAAKVDQIKEAVKDIASALMRDCQPAPKVEP